MKKHLLTPALLTTLLATSFLPSAHAILIGFESGEGYSVGALSGEPTTGTQWSGSGLWLGVVDDAGNQIAQTPASDPANFITNTFTPSAADLGGTNAASGIYNFSFDLRSDNNPGTSDFATSATIRIAGGDAASGTAIRLQIFDNGRLQYFDGTSATNASNGSGSFDLDDVTGFFSISGAINFDTSQYSLTVNGVSQGSTIGFNSTTSTSFESFQVAAGNSGALNYRQLSFDNVSLAAVPEPSTVGALVAGGLALLAFRRRRRA